MTDIASDLFDWAARRPPEKVVQFLDKRKSLPRWQAIRLKPLAGYDRAVARESGEMPPAPILRFARPHPVSPGSYPPEPQRSGAGR